MRWLRDLLKAQAAEGRTVLVSSHVLSEVAQTADELILIRKGELVAQTTLAEFTAGGRAAMRVRAADPETLATALGEGSGTVGHDEDGALLVEGLSGEQIVVLALERGIAIYELAPQRSSLEARFLEVMGEDAGEEAAP